MAIEAADILRNQTNIDYNDEFLVELLRTAVKCEPDFGAMGVVGYNYLSVRDAIKESKLPFSYRNLICQIGRLQYLEDKEFNKLSQDRVDVSTQTAILFGGTSLLTKK